MVEQPGRFMQGEQLHSVSFNGFTLDVPRGCLRRGAIEVKLRPKSFEVLRYLVENRGRLVGKEELIRAVWKDSFVTDNSLVQCLIEIRRCLSDDGQDLIRTVPRRGYIFDIPVTAGPLENEQRQTQIVKTSQSDALVDLPHAADSTAIAESGTVSRSGKRDRVSRPSVVALSVLATAAVLTLVFAADVGSVRERFLGRTLTPNIRSIVVLPLEGISNEADLDYFADGMTDALITDLAQIGSLRVISRTTAMQYRKAKKPLPQIARELGVDAAVEGTAVRSGNRVRITTQLLLAREDKHVWAQSYERDMQDILAVQDEIARDIAQQVRVHMTPEVRERLRSAPRISPEAYEAHLKSRQFLGRRTTEGASKSLEYAQRALTLQPDSALLEAGLAKSLFNMNLMYAGQTPSPLKFMPEAKAAAERALAMDESLGEAHHALAMVYFNYDWNFPAAEREFKRALELEPSTAEIHAYYGFYLSAMGRHDEAIAEMRRARELDPLSVLQSRNVGSALYYARRYDEATEQFEYTAQLDPNFPVVYNWLVWMCMARGMNEQAISWELKGLTVHGATPAELAASRELVARNGPEAYWLKKLTESRRTSPDKMNANAAYNVAGLAAQVGRKEDSLRYLRRAVDERSFWVPFLNVDPLFDKLRSDPQFQELAGRVPVH